MEWSSNAVDYRVDHDNAVGGFCGGNEKDEDDVEDDNGDGYDHDSVCSAGNTGSESGSVDLEVDNGSDAEHNNVVDNDIIDDDSSKSDHLGESKIA